MKKLFVICLLLISMTTHAQISSIFTEANAVNVNNDSNSIGSITGTRVDISSVSNGDGSYKIRATANTSEDGKVYINIPASTSEPHLLKFTAVESAGADGRLGQIRNSDNNYVNFKQISFDESTKEYSIVLNNLSETDFTLTFFLYYVTVGDYIEIDNISITPINQQNLELGNNIFAEANAANSTNDTNSIGSFTGVNTDITSESNGDGTYKLKATCNSTETGQLTLNFPASTTDPHLLKFTAAEGAGSDVRLTVGRNSNGGIYSIQSMNLNSISAKEYMVYIDGLDGTDFNATFYLYYAEVGDYIEIDDISIIPITSFSPPNSINQELYSTSNAANISNEVNATADWEAHGQTTVNSVTDIDGLSNYSIEITRGSSSGFNAAQITAISGLENGKEYNLIVRARKDVNNQSNGQINYWDGVVGNLSPFVINTTTYKDYVLTFTSDGSGFSFSAYGCSCDTVTDKIYISSISLKEVNPEAPTPATLSSTAQTDTTVDLNWSGATDDVAVTGYNIYQNGSLITTLGNVSTYQVTGLNASTAYNFTVTALDGTGNESVVSNAIAITTNTASGGNNGGSGSGVWSLNNQDVYYNNGNVGIGTNTVPTGYQLAVNGKIISEEIKVQLEVNWPDYVFSNAYKLPTLQEIEAYIQKHQHLPNIPSAKEVEKEGLQLGDMNAKLLEKIEELTLYIIQQEKRITHLEKLVKTNQ